MDDKDREKLERACKICREWSTDDNQLLLIPLKNVEEYLELEKRYRKESDQDGEKEDSGEAT